MTDSSVSLARSSDPVTSQQSAAKAAKNLSKLQGIVVSIFQERGPLTDSELSDFYVGHMLERGWPAVRYETARKRRSDLANKGVVVDSGVTRVNPFGSLEVVWELAS